MADEGAAASPAPETTGAGTSQTGSELTPAPAQTTNGNGISWYAPAETLKESDPETWKSFEKGVQSGNHKDFPTFVKHAVGLEKKMGAAIALPAKDSKPEDIEKWSKELGEKVKAHGLELIKAKDAPPATPDKYELKLDNIPEPLRSEKIIGAFREVAHKHGLSNAAVADIMAIETQRYEDVVKPIIEYDRRKSQSDFDAWATTTGKESKALQAFGGAWLAKNMSEAEMQRLEHAGLTDDPVLLKLVAKAGMDTGEDISVVDGTGEATTDSEFDDITKMMQDKKHPNHELWFHGNPEDPKRIALQNKVEQLYKRKYGTGGAE